MSLPDPLAPVERLDAAAFVRLVNTHTDATLTLLGPADAYDEILTTGEILLAARDRGLPVPRYDLVAPVPGAVAVVQERLRGVPPERATRDVAEQMVEVLDGFRGLLAGRADLPVPDLYLGRSGPGFSVHESLAGYGDRSRRLLAWIREVGAAEPSRMVGDDLVHFDFHPGNVLVDPTGRIGGIVDWDGIGRGDRRFGLVTLRFGLSSQAADPATEAWLDGVLTERLEPEVLRLYWAAMSLREVDWAIRHHGPTEVDRALTLAETRIDH